MHDGYVIGMIMAGAQRYRYRGAEHLAGSGTLVLINPDELHTGHKGTEDGWLYRAFYPDSGQITSLLAELELPTHHLPAFGATLYRDRDLVNGFCQLHRLLESPATALQQQTVWRELMLSLLQRHAAVPNAGKPGKEHRAVTLARNCCTHNWQNHPPWRCWRRRSTSRHSISPGCSVGPPVCRHTPG